MKRERFAAYFGLVVLIGLVSLPQYFRDLALLSGTLVTEHGVPRIFLRILSLISWFMPLAGAWVYTRYGSGAAAERAIRFGLFVLALLLCGIALIGASPKEAPVLACVAIFSQFLLRFLFGGQFLHSLRVIQVGQSNWPSLPATSSFVLFTLVGLASPWWLSSLLRPFLPESSSPGSAWSLMLLIYGVAVLVMAALYRPRPLQESENAENPGSFRTWAIKQISSSFFAGFCLSTAIFANLIFSWDYLVHILHVPKHRLMEILGFAAFFAAPLIPFVGNFQSRLGVKRSLLLAMGANIVLLIPLNYMYARASGFYYGNPFEEVQPDVMVLLTLAVFNLVLAAALLIPTIASFPRLQSRDVASNFAFGLFTTIPVAGLLLTGLNRIIATVTQGSPYAPATAAIFVLIVLGPLISIFFSPEGTKPTARPATP